MFELSLKGIHNGRKTFDMLLKETLFIKNNQVECLKLVFYEILSFKPMKSNFRYTWTSKIIRKFLGTHCYEIVITHCYEISDYLARAS